MKKEKEIKFRVSEEFFRDIEKAARREKQTVSAYARSRMDEDLTKGWIRKTEVQQIVSGIAENLDKYEEKNMRVVQSVRKEIKKLWEKI